MSFLKLLFHPACKGEIIALPDGQGICHLSQQAGRVALHYAVDVRITKAVIDFPAYIANQLETYELSINGNTDCYLMLKFKSARENLFVRSVKQALADAVTAASPSTTIHYGKNGSQTWCTSMEELNVLLDHLAKPAVQNDVLTDANTRYHAKRAAGLDI